MDIPKQAARIEAARLWQADEDADAALEAAREARYSGEIADKFGKLKEQLDAEFEKRRRALEDQKDAALGIADLSVKARAAQQARAAYPETVQITWSGDKEVPERCAKSGVVLLDGDEIINDEETGEAWLRAALGVAPRPVGKDEQEKAA